jgi:hypothetical protein
LVLGLHQRRRARSRTLLERAEQTASDVAAGARKIFEPR